MPFVQMENISHFLRACQAPPLSLPPHDVFLTVDLYEGKDPAQVVQCIGSFSRKANLLQPEKFARAIGVRSKGMMSPQTTGASNGGYSSGSGALSGRARAPSNTSESSTSTFNTASRGVTSGYGSTGSSKTNAHPDGGHASPTSSWSKKGDEGTTMPAWNIHQYGYMGGASQGNQGITFGGRRQITTPAPKVPSLAEKERKRREEAVEKERLRLQAEEAEHIRRVERQAEEERERIAEERRWEEETRKQREREKRDADIEKQRWEEEERKWKEEEEIRLREEKEAEARFEKERQRKRANSDARLKGQFLSQYQSEQRQASRSFNAEDPERFAERERVKDLERQLEEAKERERQYERERQGRLRSDSNQHRSSAQYSTEPVKSQEHPRRQPETPTHSHENSEDSWQADERVYLRQEWSSHQETPLERSTNPLQTPLQTPRPLPTPGSQSSNPPPQPSTQDISPSLPTRPLPDPKAYTSQPTTSRTSAFLSTNPAPNPPKPTSHFAPELTSTSEQDAETSRRIASQSKTKAGGWASKSLLEREMERERQRQQEWEEAQKATKEAAERGVTDGGTGPGESWDVNQYGYMGGDNQNRGGVVFGGRRQIIGPRPKP